MLIYRLLPWLTVAAGLISGYLRTIEMSHGFTAEGFSIPGNGWHVAALVITIIIALVSMFFSFFMLMPESRRSAMILTKTDPITSVLYYAAALVMLVGGIINIVGAIIVFNIGWLVAGILLLLSVASIVALGISLRKAAFPKALATVAILPIFWACVHLILHFQKDTQNPVIAEYMYAVLAMVFFVLLLHSETGILFQRHSAKRLYFNALMCTYCNIVYAMEIISGFITGRFASLSDRYGNYVSLLIAGAAILLSGYCFRCLLRKKVPELD